MSLPIPAEIVDSAIVARSPAKAADNYVTYKGLAIVLVSILSGATAFVLWYINTHIPSQIKSEFAPTAERIAKIEGVLLVLQNTLLKEATKGDSGEIKTKMHLVREYLEEAASREFIIQPNLIQEAGMKVIDFQPEDQAIVGVSWEAATAFVRYRSFLNAKLFPLEGTTFKAAGRRVFGPASIPPKCCFNVARLRIEDTVQPLDWGNWEEILFVNSTIIYEGNPASLKLVFFQNCKFQIANTRAGKQLSKAVLASSAPIDVDLTEF